MTNIYNNYLGGIRLPIKRLPTLSFADIPFAYNSFLHKNYCQQIDWLQALLRTRRIAHIYYCLQALLRTNEKLNFLWLLST